MDSVEEAVLYRPPTQASVRIMVLHICSILRCSNGLLVLVSEREFKVPITSAMQTDYIP